MTTASDHVSFYIVTPDGMGHLGEILSQISQYIEITHRGLVIGLPDEVLHLMYPNLEGMNFNLVSNLLFRKKECALGIVSAPSAVEWLRSVCGEHENPSKCLPDTIRAKFGDKFGLPLEGGIDVYRSAIFRPDSVEQVHKMLPLIRPFVAAVEPEARASTGSFTISQATHTAA